MCRAIRGKKTERRLGVAETVRVGVGVRPEIDVGVDVAVEVAVRVAVELAVAVALAVEVDVAVAVAVAVIPGVFTAKPGLSTLKVEPSPMLLPDMMVVKELLASGVLNEVWITRRMTAGLGFVRFT